MFFDISQSFSPNLGAIVAFLSFKTNLFENARWFFSVISPEFQCFGIQIIKNIHNFPSKMGSRIFVKLLYWF